MPSGMCSFQKSGTAVCICGFICRRIFSKCHITLFRLFFSLTDTFLLSSRTVFMLSIHRVSMGPSKMTHLRSGVSDNANSLKVVATTPSVHWQAMGSETKNRVQPELPATETLLLAFHYPSLLTVLLLCCRAAHNFGVSHRVLKEQQSLKKNNFHLKKYCNKNYQ